MIDLTTLSAAEGFIIQGDAAGDEAGFSVSAAGDVNGDGFDDLIVGASRGDDGGGNAGEAYVVFGAASGFGTDVGGRQVIDLTSLSADEGFIIQGDAAGDVTGFSVSSAGDVNGDGFDDLIVGAFRGDDGGAEAGEAYVVFGAASGSGTNVGGRQVLDLTNLSAAEGFIIQGDAAGDFTGSSVSSAGDVNGDGFDDLIVGALFGDDGEFRAGEAYVIFGTASGFGTNVGGRQVIDLTSLSAAEGFIIQGDAADDQIGSSVSSAGDVNGDGFDDLIVGVRFGDDGGGNAGEAYVIFGTASGFGTDVGGRQVIDLTTLSAAEGFIIQGDAADDQIGSSVSSAGDVNGDGFDDLIVGAIRGDDGGTDAGEAYVVFGTASGFGTNVGGRQVIDLTTLSAAEGFIIQGDAADDRTGISVSSAGDVNGDGFDDLIVGALRGDDGGNAAGEAYVVFGAASGFGTDVGGRQVIDLTTLSAAEGFIIQGDAAGDFAGISVSSAGDVNGDGFDDLIVGAFRGDDGGGDAGEGYVIFGRDFTDQVDFLGTDGNDTLTGTGADEILIGGRGDDTIDGAGGDDVIIGGAGNDTIIYDSATDTLKVDAGTGTDILSVAGAGVTIDLTAIDDHVFEGFERIDLTGGGNTLVLAVSDLYAITEDQNSLTGTGNTLVVDGAAGDAVDAGTGWTLINDAVNIGGQIFTKYTQDAATILVDNDVDQSAFGLVGTPGDDVLTGSPGADVIDGLGGNDTISGLAGNDTLIGGTGNDIIDGGTGNDTLAGGGGIDLFTDEAGDDVYSFTADDDVVEIRDAAGTADQLDIVTGAASFREAELFAFAGDADELFVLFADPAASFITGGEADNVLLIADATGAGQIEQITIDVIPGVTFTTDTADSNGITVTGSAGNDFIALTGNEDTADGLAGADIIIAAEDDVARYVLSGGLGNDILFAGENADNSLDGGDGDDILIGGFSGTDTLSGGDGADLLVGGTGPGSREMFGGADNDTYVIEAFGGTDTITDSGGADDVVVFASGVEFKAFTTSGDDLVISLANGGEVTLVDQLTTAPIERLVHEGLGLDLTFTAGLTGGAGNDFLFGTTAGETLTGNDGDDFLFGGGGNDDLKGGIGNDILFGASGTDVLDGGAGTRDIVSYRSSPDGVTVDLSNTVTYWTAVPEPGIS